jgi:type IV pilus assembly protein PilV
MNNIKIMKNKMTGRHKSRGFTLLEALIGFLILTIGMLGIASLQAISLKAGKTSVYSSVAMMKVEELFESMRANSSAAALTEYAGAGANNGCTGTNACSDVLLAQDDVFWWKTNLKAGLPGAATTTVVYTPAVAPSKLATVNITINWVERDKDSSSSVGKSYSTTANICTAVPC